MPEKQKRNPKTIATFEKKAKAFRIGKSSKFIKSLWDVFFFNYKESQRNQYSMDYGYIGDIEYDTDDLDNDLDEILGDVSNMENNYQKAVSAYDKLKTAYKDLCGHSASDSRTLDDFFCTKLSAALTGFLGAQATAQIREECALAMEFPYAYSGYRPSYRSGYAGDYSHQFFGIIVGAIDFACYDNVVEPTLTAFGGMQIAGGASPRNRLAYELRKNNPALVTIVEDALLGDNSQTQVSRLIFSSIVKSGNLHLIDVLSKLLLAAQRQEGLRQSILETCDSGTIDSHIHFLKLILENGLCRFSSVMRAFGTWSGLAYTDQKQKIVEKCVGLALKYLSDTSEREKAFDSADVTEVYLALWAKSCHDVHSALSHAQDLVASPEKYKRLVGWYFITHTANDKLKHSLAVQNLHIRDLEELAWICTNLHLSYVTRYGGNNQPTKTRFLNENYPDTDSGRLELFNQLAETVKFIGKKKTKFAETVFPWYSLELSAYRPCSIMLRLTAMDNSGKLALRLAEFMPYMESYDRETYYGLLNTADPAQRELILQGLSDKSQYVREQIVTRLGKDKLKLTDMDHLVKTLKTQSATLRKKLMTLLEKQSESLISPAIGQLLAAKDKNQLIAGVELLEIFSKKNPGLKACHLPALTVLQAKESIPQDVSIILDKLGDKNDKNEPSLKNGFGLYDPSARDFDPQHRAAMRPSVPIISDKELKNLIVPNEKELLALCEKIADVFDRNKDYEYETESYGGKRDKVLLGQSQYYIARKADAKEKDISIHSLPLADEWIAAAGEYATDKAKLAAVLSIFRGEYNYGHQLQKWYANLFSGYPITQTNRLTDKINKLFSNKNGLVRVVEQILQALFYTGETAIFDFALCAYVNLTRKIPADKMGEEYQTKRKNDHYYYVHHEQLQNAPNSHYIHYWDNLAQTNIQDDVQFTALFNEKWYLSLLAGQKHPSLVGMRGIFRAHHLGLISEDIVYYTLTGMVGAGANMCDITMPRDRNFWAEEFEKYPAAKEILAKAIDKIIAVEATRGEIVTALSPAASGIHRFEGSVDQFVSLLAAIGDVGFNRVYEGHHGYDHSRTGHGKKNGLSQLIYSCHPKPDITPESLQSALKAAKIPEKRAIQVAMYAPQWASILEEALDVRGLKSGIWFFRAHVSTGFSAEKETEVAIYSAISPQQFNDGTFDKSWFLEVYEAIGEKRFNELYKNAKYISADNGTHRRAQLYSDAVLGRMCKDETLAEITAKRNQEKLRAFALIPLDVKNKNDALRRYEFIQQFKKESRQFGSQRQASEGRAVQIALENLAITTGYGNVDRMTWAFEGAKMELLAPLMKPQSIGDAEIWLNIAEDGTPEIAVRKGEKMLKSVPKDLAKNATVLEIKEAVKQLKDQKSRARHSFESAMISQTEFPASEIVGLLNHPVLRGIVTTLALVSDNGIGFPVYNGQVLELVTVGNQLNCSKNLSDPQETLATIKATGNLRIAHPHDFITQNCWSSLQKYVYHNKIVQPFKQVFREYYPATKDELAAVTTSSRYAGHQVQPKKTVALLKTRGWTVDYEEGLQCVWHKENLITRMYAMADWFSPAEIESPTLETIHFFSRDKNKPVSFADIPPIIFSETMRDIDLVVSVAHVGGVDPEASHSTIEMRSAIARELLSLLRVENVTFQTAHAMVKGSLGEYSVHMGSGVVHKVGTGMLAILPVHSQARGRIFIPFADDDPRTAEIMSKILLLADDKKIKDPEILGQINR